MSKKVTSTEQRSEQFVTLAGPCTAETVVERSRFIAHGRRADTRAEAQSLIKEIAAAHPQATHVCWAYRVGWPDMPEEYWSDAGEPSGTAGRPIQNAILGGGLHNVAVVVVRYYGGTKLGVRGLIDAYRLAAKAALEAGKAVPGQPMVEEALECPYGSYRQVRHQIEALGGSVEHAAFAETVRFVARIPRASAKECAAMVRPLGAKGKRK